MSALTVLAVDDEQPALEELGRLLAASDLVRTVTLAPSAVEALRMLAAQHIDLVLLDIAMPGLDGLALAEVLDRFAEPPAVAFVSAYESHALRAFDLGAVGYLLKPIDRLRLERLLERVVHAARALADEVLAETITLEHGGVTRFASPEDVVLVESAGDYVRVHLADHTSYLLRMPISALEHAWAVHGFVRVHRGYLVPLRAISELRADASGVAVVAGSRTVPVSRRHVHELRDRLVGQARGAAAGRGAAPPDG
ncbi:MAG TPA: LytTR family DNA-binding domain-containing protein [Acidimicrobiales bacterium]|nr:LytTR family DNA-binding domain-containing protein [Acidimicrobiales bacterium]